MIHNPHNLTAAQVGNGWRLLDQCELYHRPDWVHKTPVEFWSESGSWIPNGNGYYNRGTFRTQLTQAQLASWTTTPTT